MQKTIKTVVNSVLFILMGNAIYGVLLYFFVTWLAGFSILLAYLGNLAFIATMIIFDEWILRRAATPENLYKEFSKLDKNDLTLNIRIVRWSMSYYMSFKTFLFVFYIAVLIFAQILKFYPGLAAENISNFINIIEYSVIILLAFKDFGEELSRDRGRTKTRLEEFERYAIKHGDHELKAIIENESKVDKESSE